MAILSWLYTVKEISMTGLSRLGRGLFVGSSLLIAAATLRVLVAPLPLVMPAMAPYWAEHALRVLTHIVFGPLALALAPLQLWQGLRRRRPWVHRLLGYVYAFSIVMSALGALALLPLFQGSLWALSGFATLAVLWIVTTLLAIDAARRRDFAAHRRWIMRSVAMTFSAVTLRLIMAPLMASGMDPLQTYDITAWGSWLLNLLVLEGWHMRRPQTRTA
jgi:uncharacterized membrane protein